MQQLAEFIPIVLFFAAFFMDETVVTIGDYMIALGGFKIATQILLVSSTLMMIAVFLFTRKLEKRSLFVYATVMILGAMTLIFDNEMFLQWKPTVVNWALGVAFIGSRIVRKESLLKLLMGSQLELPGYIWNRLDTYWIGNFIVVGLVNLLVAYSFSLEAWVTFKLYSAVGFTLLLSIATMIIVTPHLKEMEQINADEQSNQ